MIFFSHNGRIVEKVFFFFFPYSLPILKIHRFPRRPSSALLIIVIISTVFSADTRTSHSLKSKHFKEEKPAVVPLYCIISVSLPLSPVSRFVPLFNVFLMEHPFYKI